MNLNKSTSLFSFLLLLSIYASCSKPVKRITYDDNLEALYGQVKQVTIIENKPLNTDTVVIDLDEQGNILQADYNGQAIDKWSYKFDKNGKPIETIKDIGKFPRMVGKYDQEGRLANLTYDTKELKDTSDHFLKQDKYFYKYDTLDTYPKLISPYLTIKPNFP